MSVQISIGFILYKLKYCTINSALVNVQLARSLTTIPSCFSKYEAYIFTILAFNLSNITNPREHGRENQPYHCAVEVYNRLN
jgi:hypothetical protein